MFYYLLYNSTVTNFKNEHKKMLTTILYGSFMYIVIHAYLSSSSIEPLKKIIRYYWLVIMLDISCFYYIYSQKNQLSMFHH